MNNLQLRVDLPVRRGMPHACATCRPADPWRGVPLCVLQGVLEHITVNNFPIGRNVDEALRTLQVRAVHGQL